VRNAPARSDEPEPPVGTLAGQADDDA
jgi:hypothetical protein